MLLGKTMLQLDEVGRLLDPSFDPYASIRSNVTELIKRRLFNDLTKGNVYSSLLEMKEFTTALPSRLNRIMDAVTNSELEVKVTATDAETVLVGMQEIANRVTMGIVLAGLLIGASLLMRVSTNFQFWGFPGLAILCFIAAVMGACWLAISIFVHDYKNRRKFRR